MYNLLCYYVTIYYVTYKGSAENHDSDSTIFSQQIRENKHIFLKLKILIEHVDAKDCLYNPNIDHTLLFKCLIRVFKFLE